MEQFAEYGHAFVSMAGVAVFGLVLSPLTALAKTNKGVTAGGTPEQDYSDSAYRLNRAYLNLTEMMGFFVAVVFAAMLAGVSPIWVNLLASIYFVSRLVLAFVHIRGIGAQNQGPRTFLYVAGWACCLVLAVMAILAVL